MAQRPVETYEEPFIGGEIGEPWSRDLARPEDRLRPRSSLSDRP
jgi:hypothetical protein